MNSLRHLPWFAGGAAAVALGAYWWLGRKKKTDADLERERRLRISAGGRITDGTILDVHEVPENGHPESQLLVFQYDVAGVTYECSQDVTYLRHRLDLHSCRLGLPTSVKYDPQNPGNSIVIAEDWSGLRK